MGVTNEAHGVVQGEIEARELLYNEKIQAAEKYAEQGDMELSQLTMKQAEVIAEENKKLLKMKDVSDKFFEEVCDVCGQTISWRAQEEIEARKRGRPHSHV